MNTLNILNKNVLFLAGALLLAGCAKVAETPIEVPAEVPVGKTYTIIADLDNPATRSLTHYDETSNKFKFTWEEKERIGVVPGGYSSVLEFEAVDPANGRFSFQQSQDDPNEYNSFVMAVSPRDALSNVTAGDNTVSYTIDYSGEYSQEQSNAIMVAGAATPGSDGTQRFQFKHVGALVKVSYANVPAGTSAMVFSTPDHDITGSFTFNSATGVEAVASDKTTHNEARVSFKTPPTDVQESVDFYLPIPTGKYKTFNVKLVKLVNEEEVTIPGSEQTFSTASPFTVARADVVRCPVVTVVTPVSVVENFSSSKATNDKYGCGSEVSTEANREDFDYSWTPEGKVYVFSHGIRLGSSSANGSVTSSNILSTFPENESFTVKVYAAIWGTDGGKLAVTYNGITLDASPTGSIASPNDKQYSAEDFGAPLEFVFTKSSESNNLTIGSTSKRIIVDKVEIVSGGTPAPVESITVTPAESNPETVPASGGTLSYSVSTTNIDSWEAVSNNDDFVIVETSGGFNVVVARNESSSPKTATITVSGGNKSVEFTVNQDAGEGDSNVFTYVFTSKSWEATLNGGSANWISGKDGYAKSDKGIQVTKSYSGANATSPVSFSGISNITVTLAKTTEGAGSVDIMVGNQSVGTQTSFSTSSVDYSFDVNNLSGEVKIVVNCTNNSIYVKGISITAASISGDSGEGGDGEGTDVVFEVGKDSSEGRTLEKDGVVLTTTNGVWNRSDTYRIYSGATLTVTAPSGKIISAIVFTYDQNKFSTGTGALTDAGVWAGTAQSISFSTVGGQVRLTKIVVTYE